MPRWSVSTGSLILDAGERSAVLDAADFYVYDYTDYYTYSVRLRRRAADHLGPLPADQQREASRAYYTTGHGEKSLSSTLVDALAAQNIEDRAPQPAVRPRCREDCALLIIHCPATDFAGPEGACG